MPEAGFMYHKTRREGQLYPDLPAVRATLEREGWVDTPAKLPPEVMAAAGAPHAMPVVTGADGDRGPLTEAQRQELEATGRTLNTNLVEGPPAGRYDKIVDADGDYIGADLPDKEFVRLVDDMSRDEILRVFSGLGLEANEDPTKLTASLRRELVDHLRPGLDVEGAYFGGEEERLDIEQPSGDQTGAAAEQDETKGAQDLDYRTGNALADDDAEADVDTANTTGDELKAMDKADLEGWLERATKKTISAKIVELGGEAPAGNKDEFKQALRDRLAAV